MAAFVIGKSLKDRRQTKAIEELFDKADKNGNGKISVEEYVQIFAEHGIELSPEEVGKVQYSILNYSLHSLACPLFLEKTNFDIEGHF